MSAERRTKTDRVAALIARGVSPDASPSGDTPRDIDTITAEILDLKVQAGRAIMGIGQRLIEAKAALPYGEWLTWLAEKVEFSARTAENLMRIAREWSDPQLAADLGARKVLTLLALPPDERAAFVAAVHTVDGTEKRVQDMTARELERVVRERDTAQRELASAQEDRARISRDLEAAQSDIGRMRERVRELEERPVDVAVETVRDEEAIREAEERTRRSVEAEQAEKIRTEQARAEQAEKDLKDAEARITALEAVQAGAAQAVEEANARARNAERERDAARRAGASEDRSMYLILTKRIQSDADELSMIRARSRRSGDMDLAVAVGRALSALADELYAEAAIEGDRGEKGEG